jgi:hypothetical protein
MGHGLTDSDRMFSVRKPPWHGLGAVLDDHPRSIDEALDRSGLGWGVGTAGSGRAPSGMNRRPRPRAP